MSKRRSSILQLLILSCLLLPLNVFCQNHWINLASSVALIPSTLKSGYIRLSNNPQDSVEKYRGLVWLDLIEGTPIYKKGILQCAGTEMHEIGGVVVSKKGLKSSLLPLLEKILEMIKINSLKGKKATPFREEDYMVVVDAIRPYDEDTGTYYVFCKLTFIYYNHGISTVQSSALLNNNDLKTLINNIKTIVKAK